MENRISISKAARLLGLKRGELNARLAAANIETFEGQVNFEEVKCVAPSLKLSDPEILERAKTLREKSVAKYGGSEKFPEHLDLVTEIQRVTTDLIVEAHKANHYREIINEMIEELGRHQLSEIAERRDLALEMCRWLRGKVCA